MSKTLFQGTKDLYAMLTDDEKRDLMRYVYYERWKAGVRPRDVFSGNDYGSSFDIDIAESYFSEGEIKKLREGSSLFEDKTIEVKCDSEVDWSGNIAVEFKCNGKPSGIAVSKADLWAIQLSGSQYSQEITIFIETRRLRMLAETCEVKPAGDGKRARIYLVPLKRLLETRVKTFTLRAKLGLSNR